jgi:hypothetical protein
MSNSHQNRLLELSLYKRSNAQHFDEINIGRYTTISFHRTLRIPEDGKNYPLPAGLGRLPIHRVEDYAHKVPKKWLQEGGYFLPLHQKEALFLEFQGPKWHPTIAKVCVGRVNAVSGKSYSGKLSSSPQDYVVIPDQKWLDGINYGAGIVRQFVAMPLGQGYTIEAQITDEETHGGFQIIVFDAMENRFPDRDPSIDAAILYKEEMARKRKEEPAVLYSSPTPIQSDVSFSIGRATPSLAKEMGIAAGGNIKQIIHPDNYGLETWNIECMRGLTIHLVNSLVYKSITGEDPPPSPVTAEQYKRAKIPWYSYYDETVIPVKPPSVFKRILSVMAIEKRRGVAVNQSEVSMQITEELLQQIKTPSKREATEIYRARAHQNAEMCHWQAALREISLVIDYKTYIQATDYALRSRCNYYLGRFDDGAIDGSLALEKDSKCDDGLTWRAFCRKASGDFEGLREDADQLIRNEETELIGLELRAEAALLAGRYNDAIYDALSLGKKRPGYPRAEQILSEARSMANQKFHEKRGK